MSSVAVAMLTKTSLSAVRALLFVALHSEAQPWSPRAIAGHLSESPTYLAKVLRHLVRAGILKSYRGTAGGVSLERDPSDVSLLAIVEACQGTILRDICSDGADLAKTCAFHQAGAELHTAIVSVLSRWTLADFLERPGPDAAVAQDTQCLLAPCAKLASVAEDVRDEFLARGGSAKALAVRHATGGEPRGE